MSTVATLVRSAHPAPSFAVAAIAVILGIGVGLDAPRLAVLGIAVLLQQFSVGLSNDWIDVERDRLVGRTDKPIARGAISVRLAQVTSYLLVGASMALTLPLGWRATLAHLGFLVAGWAYNAWLKATPASVLAYVVGFGLLPFVVTLALPEPRLPALWAVGVGVLMGIAAHFANAIPDAEGDRRWGSRGLPQLAGQKVSVAVIAIALLLSAVVVVVGPGSFDVARLAAVAVVGALAAACWWIGTTRPPSPLLFRLILAAAVLIVALLGLAGHLLLA